MNNKFKRAMALTAISTISLTSLTGCVKPYNKPVFETIQANETAFLIPLVGNTEDQGVFESEELLEKTKVPTKEFQVPRYWVQTGRMNWQGEYKDSVRVIKVNRSPVTREWTDSKESAGTDVSNQAVTAKTKDNIEVILNVNATAMIEESLTARFLYYYNTNALSQIMDTEIKTMVHSKLIEQVGKMDLNNLDMEVIMEKVRTDVKEYFLGRGITITALGLAGKPVFPADIQQAMNEAIKAKKDQETQDIQNATAEKTAESEARQMAKRAETFQKQLEMKKLEVMEKAIEAWQSGGANVPQVMGGEGLNMIIDGLSE